MVTYVINKDGIPLMPTKRRGWVRKLLKRGEAKVVRMEPFTIKLLYEAGDVVQECTLGVDTGSVYMGCAVVNERNEVLYMSQPKLRDDIKTKMTRRRKLRRQRRRKLRYRRRGSKNRRTLVRKDRFNPTMVSKISSHIREIELIREILPITKMIFEMGTFDPHLLKMQEEGKPFNRSWGYQKGPNYGYENARHACYARDNYTCQCCKTKKGTMHAHHIIYKSQGGADTLDNLITLCEKCHDKLHGGKLKAFEKKLVGKYKGELKHATQMNSIRKQLLRIYPESIETYGYITKANRELLGLPKSHYMDAVVVATQGQKPIFKTKTVYLKRHICKGEYQLYSDTAPYYRYRHEKVNGIKKGDKVEYFGKKCFLQTNSCNGYCTLVNICGEVQGFSHLKWGYKVPKIWLLKRVQARSTTQLNCCNIFELGGF